jgi:hypothetical protein
MCRVPPTTGVPVPGSVFAWMYAPAAGADDALAELAADEVGAEPDAAGAELDADEDEDADVAADGDEVLDDLLLEHAVTAIPVTTKPAKIPLTRLTLRIDNLLRCEPHCGNSTAGRG